MPEEFLEIEKVSGEGSGFRKVYLKIFKTS